MFGPMNPYQQQQAALLGPQQGQSFSQYAQNMPMDHRLGLLTAGLNLMSNRPTGMNTAGHVAQSLGAGFGAMQQWQQMQAQKQKLAMEQKQQIFDNFQKLKPLFEGADDDTKRYVLGEIQAGRMPDPAQLTFSAPEQDKPQRFSATVEGPDGQAREIFAYQRDGRVFADPQGTMELDPLSLRPVDRSTRVSVDLSDKGKDQTIDEAMFEDDLKVVSQMRVDSRQYDKELSNIQFARQLNERFLTGPGAEAITNVQRGVGGIVRAFGGNPDDMFAGLSDAGAMRKVAMDFVMNRIAETKGAISEKEMAAFERSVFNLGNTRDANTMILNMGEAMARRGQQKADFMQAWLRKNRSLNDAEAAWEAYIQDNPATSLDGTFNVNKENLQRKVWQPYVQNWQELRQVKSLSTEEIERMLQEGQ